jgi:hypothetical protein
MGIWRSNNAHLQGHCGGRDEDRVKDVQYLSQVLGLIRGWNDPCVLAAEGSGEVG